MSTIDIAASRTMCMTRLIVVMMAAIMILSCRRPRTEYEYCVQDCRVSMRKNLAAMGFHPELIKSMGKEGLCIRLCSYPEDIQYDLPSEGK